MSRLSRLDTVWVVGMSLICLFGFAVLGLALLGLSIMVSAVVAVFDLFREAMQWVRP